MSDASQVTSWRIEKPPGKDRPDQSLRRPGQRQDDGGGATKASAQSAQRAARASPWSRLVDEGHQAARAGGRYPASARNAFSASSRVCR